MQPPYSGMKIIHDQQIQEALEHHRFHSGQETHRQGLLQMLGKVLARLTTPSGRKREGLFLAKPRHEMRGFREVDDA